MHTSPQPLSETLRLSTSARALSPQPLSLLSCSLASPSLSLSQPQPEALSAKALSLRLFFFSLSNSLSPFISCDCRRRSPQNLSSSLAETGGSGWSSQSLHLYIQSRSDHWHPDPMLRMKDAEDLNKLRFSVWLTYRMNHQDIGERWTRRALLVEEMIKVFRELDIEYRMLPLDVNVRSLPSCNSDDSPSTSMWELILRPRK
ncbi:hypothetical protein L484_003336 [Morus notabilis]|uniref:Uncharacterized protein n=1 Tax=Morus notabilis TaxID=981085 RepID=W9RC68_9ROSA|nr:hypothetical protein L484_003336 [Morus notabilis]